jgi:caffeoyl-CoA O-methyltransferase
MSAVPTPITEKIYRYINENFSSDDEFLKNLKQESKALNFPKIYISADEARFLQFLLFSIKAKNVLEIGSLGGYSAISMARALPSDGKVITIEILKERAEFIKKKVKEANLEENIEVICSSGLDFLNSFKPQAELDFVFIDADKINYLNYFNIVAPIVRQGGIISADNALAFGYVAENFDPNNSSYTDSDISDIKAIQQFNLHVRNRTDFFTTLAPIGDGVILAVKK